jgi:DNA-binding MarR family transcriptional regulator
MNFETAPDGSLAELSIRELAEWYAGDKGDAKAFEAHLLLLRAHSAVIGSSQRGRRNLLSVERFTLLRLLFRVPGHQMQMSEIGRALGVSPTSITKLVNRLVDLGLVERLPHESDKRRAWVRITPEGTAVMERNLPAARRSTRERWKGLTSEEQGTLAHLLTKLVMSLESPSRD